MAAQTLVMSGSSNRWVRATKTNSSRKRRAVVWKVCSVTGGSSSHLPGRKPVFGGSESVIATLCHAPVEPGTGNCDEVPGAWFNSTRNPANLAVRRA